MSTCQQRGIRAEGRGGEGRKKRRREEKKGKRKEPRSLREKLFPIAALLFPLDTQQDVGTPCVLWAAQIPSFPAFPFPCLSQALGAAKEGFRGAGRGFIVCLKGLSPPGTSIFGTFSEVAELFPLEGFDFSGRRKWRERDRPGQFGDKNPWKSPVRI